MSLTIARVRIKDFDRFIAAFSTRGAAKRREYGCRGARVMRSLDDPNELINVFDWDRADVERFMEDPEVPEIMRAVGLEGPPEFSFVEPIAELES